MPTVARFQAALCFTDYDRQVTSIECDIGCFVKNLGHHLACEKDDKGASIKIKLT